MNNPGPYKTPYSDIIAPLTCSIMRALHSLALASRNVKSDLLVPHAEINRHFAWLALVLKEGTDRHLVEGNDETDVRPLAIKKLRSKTSIEEPVNKKLIAFDSLRISPAERKMSRQLTGGEAISREAIRETQNYVQLGPTRISSILFRHWESCGGIEPGKGKAMILKSPSPLAILLDYLSDPDISASRTYALIAVRNYLFEVLDTFPRSRKDASNSTVDKTSISGRQILLELSYLDTSLSQRYQSKGADKLPEKKGKPGRLLRHFLSIRRVFAWRFTKLEVGLKYLKAANYAKTPKELEFDKSSRFNKLPEAGELENELLGLPLPIRGADVLFRGGLNFSAQGGLRLAIHGEPGAGKTSFALGVAGSLAPLGINTIFLSAEESKHDLFNRAREVTPFEFQRLSFCPNRVEDWLTPYTIPLTNTHPLKVIEMIEESCKILTSSLNDQEENKHNITNPCRLVVILDGLHDLFLNTNVFEESGGVATNLENFIESLRDLDALVILTTADNWVDGRSLDYMVDAVATISQNQVHEYGEKPDRRFTIRKMRHQLCALGTHGVAISGRKGLRFSPQINYLLDTLAIWKPQLPNRKLSKKILYQAIPLSKNKRIKGHSDLKIEYFKEVPKKSRVEIYQGSHIFINGEGSGGKAALSLKLAIAPYTEQSSNNAIVRKAKRILIISFLYPHEYYHDLVEYLKAQMQHENEFWGDTASVNSLLKVLHLYPGYLKPNDLFNKIIWELNTAELQGRPYTGVIIDGIHNLFLQFPSIEEYKPFWPQLFNLLRQWPLTVITTHTTLVVQSDNPAEDAINIDDKRSEPLRHALIQKTDFQFEVSRVDIDKERRARSPQKEIEFPVDEFLDDYEGDPGLFVFSVRSAIGQPIPKTDPSLYWHREKMTFFQNDF